MKIIVAPKFVKLITFGKYSGIAIYPFLFVANQKYKEDKILINHEKIHFKQQKELAFLLFYFLYFVSYIFNLCKYKNHNKAYRNIPFEKEAYSNHNNFRTPDLS